VSEQLKALELRGLEIRRDGRLLLGPLDLELARGESVLLVGPSGSGKTTLLRAIAGLTVPSAGSVSLAGRPASEAGRLLLRPEERRIGMLFQGGALWPHMSVARTLRFVLAQRGLRGSQANSRVQELLRDVRLEGFESRLPGTLSGGERQRLALARALASEPEILLLDEPLGPLDTELRQGLLETLGALHERQGWTVVHVTHDPAEARPYASRVLELANGKLVKTEVPQA
jgi:ABC-type sulfate/molybdate transport systems ATPase subunit